MVKQITRLPAAPSRARPAQFSDEGNAFLGALPDFGDEINEVAVEINSTAVQVEATASNVQSYLNTATNIAVVQATAQANASASSAALSASSANDSKLAAKESEIVAGEFATIVQGAVNFRGEWSNLVGAIAMPATVLHSGKFWALLQPLADITAAEPGVSAAWVSTNLAPATQAEMEVGTEVALRSMSPLRVAQAIAVRATPEILPPTNVSPANGASQDQETLTLKGFAYYEMYGAAQSAIQVEVHTSSDFSAPAYSSGDQPAGTSFTLPAGVLQVNATYYWRMRYKSVRGVYSDWSAPTSFATAAELNSYIPAPTATPSNFGDVLEGGFYAGMIWNELTQSSTRAAIGTGSKTFTVPSMAAAPIVYGGQTVEVRSRANPANKFVGTVTGAAGTNLTINVTSIGGSGTFTDWSIMSRYRVIVAPKAGGENVGIALKNANTPFPVACQTLTEGLRATQAMRDADTSAVYPAAHWARGLNIGGRADWYIPARDELELCWRNLKPTPMANYVAANRPAAASFSYANNGSYGDAAATHGTNNNSAPPKVAYTAGVPGQTAAAAFRTGGAETFEFGSVYWSSSDYNATNAWIQLWDSTYPGYQLDNGNGKTDTRRVRAIRRSII